MEEKNNIIRLQECQHFSAETSKIMEGILAPLPEDLKTTAKAILQKLSLPLGSVEFLTRRDFWSLRELEDKNCAKCKGNRQNCDKISVAINENGSLTFTRETCQKAVQFRETARATELIKAASVPRIFAQFRAKDFKTANEAALDAAESAVVDGASVYIFGDVGTGKTMLASIIANERAYQGKSSLFISVAETLESLREFNQHQKFTDSKTREDKLKTYAAAKCLIVDDVGAEKPTDWAVETMFKIFNRRYNDGLQNVTTSNLSPEELEKHLGARIARRILHGATIVELK